MKGDEFKLSPPLSAQRCCSRSAAPASRHAPHQFRGVLKAVLGAVQLFATKRPEMEKEEEEEEEEEEEGLFKADAGGNRVIQS